MAPFNYIPPTQHYSIYTPTMVIATLETVVEDGEVEGEMACLPHYGGVKVCVKLSVGASENV